MKLSTILTVVGIGLSLGSGILSANANFKRVGESIERGGYDLEEPVVDVDDDEEEMKEVVEELYEDNCK